METSFFQRWLSRKLAARENCGDNNPADNNSAELKESSQPYDLQKHSDLKEFPELEEQGCHDGFVAVGGVLDDHEGLAKPEMAEAETAANDEPKPTMDDVAEVTFESGVTSFMKTGVEKSVKKAALRKLFHSDEYNYVSDMDDHTEDFSNVPALDSSVTKQLRNWVNQVSEDLEKIDSLAEKESQSPLAEDKDNSASYSQLNIDDKGHLPASELDCKSDPRQGQVAHLVGGDDTSTERDAGSKAS